MYQVKFLPLCDILMLHFDCLPKYNILTILKDELSLCNNASVVARGFGVEPPKFSEFILYTNQNMFSPYMCSTRMCSGVARGFYMYTKSAGNF